MSKARCMMDCTCIQHVTLSTGCFLIHMGHMSVKSCSIVLGTKRGFQCPNWQSNRLWSWRQGENTGHQRWLPGRRTCLCWESWILCCRRAWRSLARRAFTVVRMSTRNHLHINELNMCITLAGPPYLLIFIIMSLFLSSKELLDLPTTTQKPWVSVLRSLKNAELGYWNIVLPHMD